MMPIWLRGATIDLVGVDRADELSLERDVLEREKRELSEKGRKERDALKKIEEAKRQKQVEYQKIQEEIYEKEFGQLVAEIKPLGFIYSSEASKYIVNNQLGYKYKTISGHLEMELDGVTWNFKGGFPPKIYARLCQELGLCHKNTRAKPKKFESFKELMDKNL